MNGLGLSIATSPLLPWWAVYAFGAAAVVLLAFGAWRHAKGVVWRLVALGILLLILVNPSPVEEQAAS